MSKYQHSNLTFREISFISYDIMCREPACHIQQEYRLSSRTITDWGMFCRETMPVFTEGCSEKIRGDHPPVVLALHRYVLL